MSQPLPLFRRILFFKQAKLVSVFIFHIILFYYTHRRSRESYTFTCRMNTQGSFYQINNNTLSLFLSLSSTFTHPFHSLYESSPRSLSLIFKLNFQVYESMIHKPSQPNKRKQRDGRKRRVSKGNEYLRNINPM